MEDRRGTVVPNAEVILTHTATAEARQTRTTRSGDYTVTVTAPAPIVDSAMSSLGQVIENKQILDLPLNCSIPFVPGLLSGNAILMLTTESVCNSSAATWRRRIELQSHSTIWVD